MLRVIRPQACWFPRFGDLEPADRETPGPSGVRAGVRLHPNAPRTKHAERSAARAVRARVPLFERAYHGTRPWILLNTP